MGQKLIGLKFNGSCSAPSSGFETDANWGSV